MTGADKAAVRTTVFSHLAGIVLAPTVNALAAGGALRVLSRSSDWVVLDDVVARTNGNRGYVRVALRLLASAGWLLQRVERNGRAVSYLLTEAGRVAIPWAPRLYGQVTPFLSKTQTLKASLFESAEAPLLPLFKNLVFKAANGWGIGPQTHPVATAVAEQLREHLDGVLIGPIMVNLSRAGVLARLFHGPIPITSLGGNAAMVA
jgi:hypothetical protein